MGTSKRIEVELPFGGFYESVHDSKIDDAFVMHYTYDYDTGDDREMTEAETDAVYMALDTKDWRAIQIEYCEQYIYDLASDTGLDFQYADMTSPQFYNYGTDRLFATLPAEQLAKVRAEVESYPEYAEEIRERFTSRDGFWSNYDADYTSEEWTRAELDQCQYGVIFELYFKHELDQDYDLYYVEAVNEFGSIDAAICKIDEYLKAEQVAA